MQRRGNGSASESESYFFKVYPAYFKVDHGFAKTIKPNTNYRLSLFKGTSVHTKVFKKLISWPNLSKENSLVEKSCLTRFLSIFLFPYICQIEMWNSPSKYWKPSLIKQNNKLQVIESNQVIL